MAQSPADDEEQRLAALSSYKLVGEPRLEVLDSLTRLSAGVFGTSMSSVTLVDRDIQWFAGKTGLADDGTSRDVSFCSHVVSARDLLVVPDAREDREFRTYPNVTGDPNIRLYAGAPLVDQDGYVLGAVCIIDDRPGHVGDRERDMLVQFAEQASGHLAAVRSRLLLADLGAELSRANSREEDLVATVSHELRTPVTSIQGYLEMLIEDEQLAPYRDYLEPIRRNGDRLVRMVEHLIAGARNATGVAPDVERAPVDLGAVAEAAVTMCEAYLNHRDVTCVIETTGAPGRIRGDAAKLTKAVEQLIRNAAAFSPSGSKVRVVVAHSPNNPAIQVIDEGVGIPRDELAHVTDRFYRGRQARESAVAGVGLGLAIAKAIATAHGGSLTLTSQGHNSGTTARLSLPA